MSVSASPAGTVTDTGPASAPASSKAVIVARAGCAPSFARRSRLRWRWFEAGLNSATRAEPSTVGAASWRLASCARISRWLDDYWDDRVRRAA